MDGEVGVFEVDRGAFVGVCTKSVNDGIFDFEADEMAVFKGFGALADGVDAEAATDIEKAFPFNVAGEVIEVMLIGTASGDDWAQDAESD